MKITAEQITEFYCQPSIPEHQLVDDMFAAAINYAIDGEALFAHDVLNAIAEIIVEVNHG